MLTVTEHKSSRFSNNLVAGSSILMLLVHRKSAMDNERPKTKFLARKLGESEISLKILVSTALFLGSSRNEYHFSLIPADHFI